MLVGVSVCELHLPGARSLKQKRRVVKSVVDRLHRRFRVSIAETAHHDLHQRTEISIAVVGTSERDIVRLMAALRDAIDGQFDALITRWDLQIVEMIG